VQDSIGRFWKNRLTLIKFGRRYCRNFFLNLSKTAFSVPLPLIQKPILAAGAGEGLEQTLLELTEDAHLRETFFILAADAALSAFMEAGIAPDALVSEESQSVIVGAFAGCKNACAYAFLSLSSCYNGAAFAAKKSCFYATEFEDRTFIRLIIIRCEPQRFGVRTRRSAEDSATCTAKSNNAVITSKIVAV